MDIKIHTVLKEKCYSNFYNLNEIIASKNRNNELNKQEIIEIINEITSNDFTSLYASGNWKWLKNNKHNLFYKSIESKNVTELYNILSNFFRDDASHGLVSNARIESGWNPSLSETSTSITKFANSILSDLDTCVEFSDLSNINDLKFPNIGNPYGIELNNILILPDQCRHYYLSYMIFNFITNKESHINPDIILEIGGGYGGVLINLIKRYIKNKKKFKYINIDLNSSLFVCMYIMKSYIKIEKLDLKIYYLKEGEILDNELLSKYDIFLVGENNSNNINVKTDIFFNSHSLSEMIKEDINKYISLLEKTESKYFYHINSNFFPWKESKLNNIEINGSDFPVNEEKYKKIFQSISPWVCGSGRYREFIYIRI